MLNVVKSLTSTYIIYFMVTFMKLQERTITFMVRKDVDKHTNDCKPDEINFNK